VQQAILTAIMDANPIMLVVLAIGLLVAGFVMAWQHCQTFRNIMAEAFRDIAVPVLTFVKIYLTVLKFITDAYLTFIGFMIHSAAQLFGWVPGIGGQLKAADKAFGGFKKGVDDTFNGAIKTVDNWTNSVNGMPQQVKLQGNIDDLTKKIETAKKQLLNAPAAKRATLTADISNLQNNVSQAQSDINNLHGKTVTITYNGVNEGSSGPNGYQSTTGFTYGRADGGIRYAAAGLIDRQAMMARAGSNILWAEGSTGGESYIPHAASKRPRSRRIAEETVGILGGRVHWGGGAQSMTHGGAPSAPAPAYTGGGTTTITHVTVNVAGTVTSERNLRDEIQAQLLRLGGRNSQTYQPYHR
jgi:hypothetical protein